MEFLLYLREGVNCLARSLFVPFALPYQLNGGHMAYRVTRLGCCCPPPLAQSFVCSAGIHQRFPPALVLWKGLVPAVGLSSSS
ncbi:hypothetical protein AOLI_G00071150 [Acnodon oligacanthus]